MTTRRTHERYTVRVERDQTHPHRCLFEILTPESSEENAQWFASVKGEIRFDGCCNWESSTLIPHLCGVDDLREFHEAFQQAFAMAAAEFSDRASHPHDFGPVPVLNPEWKED